MAKITREAIKSLPIGRALWEGPIFYRKGKTGGSWGISYYAGGRQKRERIGRDGEVNKTDALKALKARSGELVQGRFDIASTDKSPLFEDFEKNYIAWSKENKKSWDRDESMLKNHLTPFFGKSPLNLIKPGTIENYRTKRRKVKVSVATINREVALLKAIYNKAILWGKARENPVKKIKLYKENNTIVRYLTKKEAGRLIEACNDFLRPIVLLALNTGMRQGEIFKLQWKDVNLKRGIITILDGKDGKDAHLPINEDVQYLLSDFPRFVNNPHIFPGMKPGAPLNNVHHSWNTALKKAGIENFRFHDLRHTFASWLVMGGVDIYTVKDLLRHKSIEMTLRYAHLTPEHKKAALNRLGGMISNLTSANQVQIPKTQKPAKKPLYITDW